MSDLKKPKILVIDDDPSMIELLEQFLTSEGYQISTAPNGEAGIKAVLKEKPALVLLDLLMPGMHGFDVCQMIKEEPSLQGTKVLILSGKLYQADQRAALRLGADGYLTKPFEVSVLAEKISALIGRP